MEYIKIPSWTQCAFSFSAACKNNETFLSQIKRYLKITSVNERQGSGSSRVKSTAVIKKLVARIRKNPVC